MPSSEVAWPETITSADGQLGPFYSRFLIFLNHIHVFLNKDSGGWDDVPEDTGHFGSGHSSLAGVGKALKVRFCDCSITTCAEVRAGCYFAKLNY